MWSLALIGCALRQPPASPPPAVAASCATSIAPGERLRLTGAPDDALLRELAERPGGALLLEVPAELPFEHVAALARAAQGSVSALEVVLEGPEGAIALPLELSGDLAAGPWRGVRPPREPPHHSPELLPSARGVGGSAEEGTIAAPPVEVWIDRDRAWVSVGSRRDSAGTDGLAEIIGRASVDAERPLGLLNATAETTWAQVAAGLAALACGGEYGVQAPGIVVLGAAY